MQLRLVEEPSSCLPEYARVPIAFDVRERVDVGQFSDRPDAPSLHTRTIGQPYIKDYDAIAGNSPLEWASRWDLSKWRFVAGYLDGRRVGGAAVIVDARDVEGGASRPDVAVLWDVRVHPEYRRRAIGRRLLAFAEEQCRAHPIRWMKAETQDVNVGACRFYARAGYLLRAVDRFAYPDFPDEARMIWQKDLRAARRHDI